MKLTSILEELKLINKDKEEEYHIREKQIALYLQCKKSFFGKIRYYFKGNKYNDKIKKNRELPVEIVNQQETQEIIYDTKEYYTIEDLVDITKILDRIENQIKKRNL